MWFLVTVHLSHDNGNITSWPFSAKDLSANRSLFGFTAFLPQWTGTLKRDCSFDCKQFPNTLSDFQTPKFEIFDSG